MAFAPSGSGRLEVLIAVGELAFVDDQARVDRLAFVLTGHDGGDDLVERHEDVLEILAEK